MTTNMQLTQLNGGPPAELLEKVLLTGDLTQLTPDERLDYYSRVCQTVGLNPLTRPFEYLYLSGRLILYARKDATEQLAALHGISIDLSDGRVIEGVYVVRARAVQTDRYADATGAVVIEHLGGESKANALLKAETKAARRAVLRLVGLGWLDETEVETIPGAMTIEVDAETGEIREPAPRRRSKKQITAGSGQSQTTGKSDKHAPLYEWLASKDRTLEDVGRVMKTEANVRNINSFLKNQGIKSWEQFFALLEETWSGDDQAPKPDPDVETTPTDTTVIETETTVHTGPEAEVPETPSPPEGRTVELAPGEAAVVLSPDGARAVTTEESQPSLKSPGDQCAHRAANSPCRATRRRSSRTSQWSTSTSQT